MERHNLQEYDPELLENMPPISCPELYADDNDVYFSEFGEGRQSGPLEDIRTLKALLNRLEKLEGLIRKLTRENMAAFNVINGELRQKKQEQDGSLWDLDTKTLSANELLFLVCYPFFDRWGGSWEVRYALSGNLGKYLTLYKRKLQEETGGAVPASQQTDNT